MVTNLETRQNDVVEMNNPWPIDTLRKLYHWFKKGVEKTKKGINELREINREKQQKKDAEKYENTDSIREDVQYTTEIENGIKWILEKVGTLLDVSNTEDNNIFNLDAVAPVTQVSWENHFGKKMWSRFCEYINNDWQMIFDELHGSFYLYYYKDNKNRYDIRLLMKDPDGKEPPTLLNIRTIWNFRRTVDMLNIFLDGKIKEAQTKTKRAMERFVWQKIAQNNAELHNQNEEYHQQEEQQADVDLETQLWNLV